MRRAVLLSLSVLAAAPHHARAAGTAGAQLSEPERAFCADELQMVEKRRKIFEAQGLSAPEVARKNEGALRDLADCRERFRAKERRAAESKEDLDEVLRRVGPNATEMERERVLREIRRERLGARRPSTLSAEEKAELEAGMADEMAATHAALDAAHARDPAFLRMVHSALACMHGSRREEVLRLIASEEALLKIGTGDKQRLYALRSQLRESEGVLARSREAARSHGFDLERCTKRDVAILAHCFSRALAGERAEAGCESEEMQQYVRFVR